MSFLRIFEGTVAILPYMLIPIHYFQFLTNKKADLHDPPLRFREFTLYNKQVNPHCCGTYAYTVI